MNINAVLPFCQFPTRRPLAYQWVIEYAKKCRMQLEFLVLYQILSEVEAVDSDNTWGYHGQCCLSIQAIADTWGMSLATVRSAIKCLELSGIITVQYSRGRSSNVITVTPHTTWVVSNFRELRTPSKKPKVSPTPDTPSADTDTTPTPDTPATVTSGNIKPILKPKVSPTPATNTPPATNGLPYTTPTEADSLRFNNDKNGKKLRVSPAPTPATNITNITNTTDTRHTFG